VTVLRNVVEVENEPTIQALEVAALAITLLLLLLPAPMYLPTGPNALLQPHGLRLLPIITSPPTANPTQQLEVTSPLLAQNPNLRPRQKKITNESEVETNKWFDEPFTE
jgi:hypothetical protein